MTKKLLVFGANGRLGRDIVSTLTDDFSVTAVDIQREPAVSGSDYRQMQVLEDVVEMYQGSRYYAVIHCQQIKPVGFTKTNLFDLQMDEYDRIMNTNLKLSLLSTQHYLRSVRNNSEGIKGRIINFVSTYAAISSNPSLYDGTEMGNPSHYTISKAGLLGLTKYVAANIREYGVLCNSIAPHGIENNQGLKFQQNFASRSPIGRLSTPSEVLPAVKFLLDDKNTYVNGANIAVDGGWTAC